ncbi:MAG: methyltransferase, partial [Bacteroidia bacterium]
MSKTRQLRMRGLRLTIPAGVFPPHFLLSTSFMMDVMKDQRIEGNTLLEMGAGSGALALMMARQGAKVTAVDISATAVSAINENARRNALPLEVLESDLFSALPGRVFDWILVNPPYYPANPKTEAEHAWFCGPEFEYFHRFYSELGNHVHGGSRVWMVLSEDCDLQKLEAIALQHGWAMASIFNRTKWFERNY